MKVKIKKLHPDSVLPTYAKEGDAGLDLVAVSKKIDDFGNIHYGTGLAFEIPKGYVGLVFPRSSICKTELDLTNSVGVIDSGYRGEVTAKFKPSLSIGHDNSKPVKSYAIGEKMAQMIIIPYPHIEFEEVDELSETERGENGYGSTGK